MTVIKELIVNFENGTVTCNKDIYLLSDPIGFSLVGEAWLRTGWDAKYVYSFTWLGRPIIQQPEDMFRIQELIYKLKPDYIIETGIAHGGSLIYYASLCDLIGKGHVIGIDIEIRPHNREMIERHELYPYITLIEGDSTSSDVFLRVKDNILKLVRSVVDSDQHNPTILVILDSGHTKDHVLQELNLYSQLVSIDSYIIACDGYIKELVSGGPRTEQDWSWNNPIQAATEFVKNNQNFILEEPKFLFNEGTVNKWVSYWSKGFIKRTK